MVKYTCIDSFCGAGGLGLGLQQAGFDIRLSFDIDNRCIQTIEANKKYFSHPAFTADINDMLDGRALNICKMQRGELFLLAGGPPCQGFSVQRRGADEDPRNQLVFKYAQLVDELYPRYFVMENVPRARKSNAYARARALYKEHNYGLTEVVLDASRCGVPQRRNRFFCCWLYKW